MSHILVKCRFSDLSMTRVVDIAYSLSLSLDSYHRAISLLHSAPAPLMRSRASLGVSFSEGSLVPVGVTSHVFGSRSPSRRGPWFRKVLSHTARVSLPGWFVVPYSAISRARRALARLS